MGFGQQYSKSMNLRNAARNDVLKSLGTRTISRVGLLSQIQTSSVNKSKLSLGFSTPADRSAKAQ